MKNTAAISHPALRKMRYFLMRYCPLLYTLVEYLSYRFYSALYPEKYQILLSNFQPLPPKKQFEIVVARHAENLGWTYRLHKNVTLYVKSEYIAGTRLPNVGREFGTYLYHIVHHYNQLADRTLFVQGHPFDHPLLPLRDFCQLEVPIAGQFAIEPLETLNVFWTPRNQQLTPASLRAFLRLIGCRDTYHYVIAAWGAQFAVDRSLIISKPLTFWQHLYDISQQPHLELAGTIYSNHSIGYFFEIFWWQIFTMKTPWGANAPATAH